MTTQPNEQLKKEELTLSENQLIALKKLLYFSTRMQGVYTGIVDTLNDGSLSAEQKLDEIRAKAQDMDYALMENNPATAALMSFIPQNE